MFEEIATCIVLQPPFHPNSIFHPSVSLPQLCFSQWMELSELGTATSPSRPLRLSFTSKIHKIYRFPFKLSCAKNALKLATRNQKRSSKTMLEILKKPCAPQKSKWAAARTTQLAQKLANMVKLVK